MLRSVLSEIRSFTYSIPQEVDFVISLNILSQLSIIITDYLKRVSTFSETELNEIAAVIQQNHINSLPKDKCILISDFEEELYDEDDKLLGVNPLIFVDLPKGNSTEKWQWKFDSSMTYRDDIKTFFNVIAVDF